MSDPAFFPATAMPDDDWWHILWPDPQSVLTQIGISRSMKVVDLCCGNGHFTTPLADLVGSEGKIVAVDVDPAMLAMARSNMEKTLGQDGLARCDWLQIDAFRIEHEWKQGPDADVVLMANTFHGVPAQTALARAVANVLKPGGVFAIINWHARPREETVILEQMRGPATSLRMSPEMLEQVVVPAGFCAMEVINLPPYHYAALFTVA